MKILSFNQINKDIKTVANLMTSGIYSLFGRGTNSFNITSGSGDSLYSVSKDLEFYNLTIQEGVSIRATNISNVAFLKVNGTLTVNGHLHMDNIGGTFNDNGGVFPSAGVEYTYSKDTSTHYFDNYKLNTVNNNSSCSELLYGRLSNYCSQEPIVNCKVALTGAGPVGVYNKFVSNKEVIVKNDNVNKMDYGHYEFGVGLWRWVWDDKEGYDYAVQHVEYVSTIVKNNLEAVSCISGGGELNKIYAPNNDIYYVGGAGGGMLVTYSESIKNMGSKFTINGEKYPLNIHANGGNQIKEYTTLDKNSIERGGGCLIIAARHIVIGPNGSITCDGGNGNGLMTLGNMIPKNHYLYNNGAPIMYDNSFSGGSGFAYSFIR